MNLILKEFDEGFLKLSWKWINDPVIKELISASVITKEEQNKWFKEIRKQNDYLIWGIVADKTPIGVCGLKKITGNDCEYWGYIGEKKYWGKGLGVQMMVLMENEAREKELKSIWLQVNKSNIRATKLYEKMGYKVEDISNSKLIMRKII